MFETLSLYLGPEIGPRAASVWLGLALGLAFGALAFLTRFCLRRALVGPRHERRAARGVWALAFAVAMIGTQAAVAAGWIDFGAHRFHAASLPVLLLVAGGLLFGAGAVLARGCITRLTVLTGGGNLRALSALFVFAVAAHATLQGALTPVRTGLASVTVDPGAVSLAGLPGGAWTWTAALAAAALAIAFRSGAGRWSLAGAALLGATVPAGWIGTGYLLHDEFDPIALESLSFTAPWADTLFWSIASTLRAPGFGVGLIGGVLAGSFAAALLSRRFAWEGFEGPAQMGRSLSGAAMMGVGGVLAGGCTVGAGLSGIPTLSLAAILAFGSIVAGILAAGALEARAGRGARGLVAAE
ncbi:YeeE/YedE family protein [Roseibacterium sp. SDUM158017]|uniref:YeeE/YedE family protein n=1 Tax=Roseicyclus salinarum TaxID=3036773 RepID=UPI0024155AD1|nr:YeeE/YedE family protein [Roseibacterium sp. SDUM158017]MDG4648278.1 YeeE/YedE family protein [Roseibacterium sp. SDUM158017]